jgi:hypothetical protein
MRLKTCPLILIFALLLQTAVSADPPTLSIEQQATLAPGGVIVIVDVNCGDGETVAVVEVGVRQGNEVGASIAPPVLSTGSRQRVGVFVPGVFTTGEASASALLECAGLFSGSDLGATIKIVE